MDGTKSQAFRLVSWGKDGWKEKVLALVFAELCLDADGNAWRASWLGLGAHSNVFGVKPSRMYVSRLQIIHPQMELPDEIS